MMQRFPEEHLHKGRRGLGPACCSPCKASGLTRMQKLISIMMQIKIPWSKHHKGSIVAIVRESTLQIPRCARTLVGHVPRLSGSSSAAGDAWRASPSERPSRRSPPAPAQNCQFRSGLLFFSIRREQLIPAMTAGVSLSGRTCMGCIPQPILGRQ